MKKLTLYIASLLSAFFVFISCGGGEHEGSLAPAPLDPDSVALLFMEAIETGEVDGLEEYMHFSSKADKERYSNYFDRVNSFKARGAQSSCERAGFTAVSAEVNGDTAFVKVQGMSAFDKNTTVEMRLLRVGRHWKVDGSFPLTHLKKR